MASPTINYDEAAEILLDALILGDETTCERWKISRKTIERYRKRIMTDRQLSQAVARRTEQVQKSWSVAREDFLKRALDKLSKLVEGATPEQISDVTEAVRVVGELQITLEALGNDEAAQQGSGPAEASPLTGSSRPAVH